MQVTAILTPAEEGGFVAYDPETGTTSQGDTIETAIAAHREAVELYWEAFPMRITGHPLITPFSLPAHAAAKG